LGATSGGDRALCERVGIIGGSASAVIGTNVPVIGTSGSVTDTGVPVSGSGGTVVARVARDVGGGEKSLKAIYPRANSPFVSSAQAARRNVRRAWPPEGCDALVGREIV